MFKLFEHEIIEMPELTQEKLDAFAKIYNENEGQSFLAENGDTLYFYKEAPHMVQRLAGVVSGNKFYQYGLVSPYVVVNAGATMEEVHANSEYARFLEVRKPEPTVVEITVSSEEVLGDNFDHIGATYRKTGEGEDEHGKYHRYFNENLNIVLLVRVGDPKPADQPSVEQPTQPTDQSTEQPTTPEQPAAEQPKDEAPSDAQETPKEETPKDKVVYNIMGVDFEAIPDVDYNAKLARYAKLTEGKDFFTQDGNGKGWKVTLVMRNVSTIPNDVQTTVLIDVLGIFLNLQDLSLVEAKLVESESTLEKGFDIIRLTENARTAAIDFINKN